MPQVGVHRDSPARAAWAGRGGVGVGAGNGKFCRSGNFILGSLKFGPRRNRPLQEGTGLCLEPAGLGEAVSLQKPALGKGEGYRLRRGEGESSTPYRATTAPSQHPGKRLGARLFPTCLQSPSTEGVWRCQPLAPSC